LGKSDQVAVSGSDSDKGSAAGAPITERDCYLKNRSLTFVRDDLFRASLARSNGPRNFITYV
jgi:hypothetical protein